MKDRVSLTARSGLVLCALLFVFASACASTSASLGEQAEASMVTVQHMAGDMLTTSPSGDVPYGKPVQVLVRRSIDLVGRTILEETWHGTEHRVTRWINRAGTGLFDVNDTGKTFSGTISLDSGEWSTASLNYALVLSNGKGEITGSGSWDGPVYRSNKLFSDPDGIPRARMRDELRLITTTEFEVLLKQRIKPIAD